MVAEGTAEIGPRRRLSFSITGLSFARLIALLASSGYLGAIGGGLAQALWIGFDGFIAILQAYIFMMLTIAYISMAHEHH